MPTKHRTGRRTLALATLLAASALAAHASLGPDVTVYSAHGDIRSTTARSPAFVAYSLGTTSCNIGSTPVNWCDNAGGCGRPDLGSTRSSRRTSTG